jgi:hypothetical protein
MKRLLILLITIFGAFSIVPAKAQALTGYQGNLVYNRQVAIASGQTASAVIDAKGFSLVGVLLPAAFTGTSLTFQASVDGTNFFAVNSTTSGSSLSYTVAQGNYYAIDPTPFYGIRYLKIVSGSSEAANRVLTVALKGI